MNTEAIYLLEQAGRCRRLADGVSDERTATTLRLMADEYEARARVLAAVDAEPDSAPTIVEGPKPV
jgi:hypothetical protein